jgi:hypothetical protein
MHENKINIKNIETITGEELEKPNKLLSLFLSILD